jgi:single-stranded-DNA-specific exonuclease
MAAGLTVERNHLEALAAFLASEIGEAAQGARDKAGLDIDGALHPGGATQELMSLIDKAGPYGQGNPQPRFAFPAVRVKFAKIVAEAHVRAVLEAQDSSRLEAIAFRAAGQPLGDMLMSAAGMPLHVAGQLRRDTWGGRDRIELAIDDAADPRKQG